MKKILVILCMFLTMFSLVNYAAADGEYEPYPQEESEEDLYGSDAEDIRYEKTPVNKLGRGVINTATCWAEIPAQMAKVSKEHDPALGCTLGVVEGAISGIVRGATGIFDALTFFIPPYDKPIMKPEYSLTNADNKIKEYLW